MSKPKQDQFLGVLLGMAIGDALGMPLAGLTADQIERQHGRVSGYLPLNLPDGTSIQAGEFTDESEIVLSIVESATLNEGRIDPETIAARLVHIQAGESERWLHPATSAMIARLEAEGRALAQPGEGHADFEDVPVRGLAIGLLHSMASGESRWHDIYEDSSTVARLTHGRKQAADAVSAVAYATAALLDHELELHKLASFFETMKETFSIEPGDLVDQAVDILSQSPGFEEAVFEAVNRGGPADSLGALVGGLAASPKGVSTIPQYLIDGLESRIYISLAAPWLYRAAQRRAGILIDIIAENRINPN